MYSSLPTLSARLRDRSALACCHKFLPTMVSPCVGGVFCYLSRGVYDVDRLLNPQLEVSTLYPAVRVN